MTTQKSAPHRVFGALLLILLVSLLLGHQAIASASPHLLPEDGTDVDLTLPKDDEVDFSHFAYLPLVVKPRPWVAFDIANGGFEIPWEEGQPKPCLIFHTDGNVELTEVLEIRTPPGWVTWFRHGMPVEHDHDNTDGWIQPEVRKAEHRDPDRMHSGQYGIVLFKTFGVFDAGFLQQVTVLPGQDLRLNGWAHAWSNKGEYPAHRFDPNWSEGSHVGFNAFAAPEGTEGLDWDERNFTFWLGIDPTGETNPDADTVVWGQGMHIYNAYHPVPPVVTTAQSDTVTLFLRSRNLWRFWNSDAYWDDITLEVR